MSGVVSGEGWDGCRRWWLGGLRWVWAGCAAALLLGVLHLQAGQPGMSEPDPVIHFGFSAGLMQDANENDSRAALKAWVDAILKTGPIHADREVLFCRNQEEMLAALRARRVNALALLTTEYFTLREQIKFERFIVGIIDKSAEDHYVLLVRKNSEWNRLEDLRGRRLNVLRGPRMSIATPWLNNVLREKQLPAAADFFGHIDGDHRLNQVVLPVFFGKVDACLVPAKGFQTMSELNPQVEARLRVVESSPVVIPSLMCFPAGNAKAEESLFIKELEMLHTRASGQQVLTVFQTERMRECDETSLAGTLRLLAECARWDKTAHDMSKRADASGNRRADAQ